MTNTLYNSPLSLLIDSVLIVTITTVYVYDLHTLKKTQEYSTYENNYGLASVNSKSYVIPGREKGSLRIIVYLSLIYHCRVSQLVIYISMHMIILFVAYLFLIQGEFLQLLQKREHWFVCIMQIQEIVSKFFAEGLKKHRFLFWSYILFHCIFVEFQEMKSMYYALVRIKHSMCLMYLKVVILFNT